METKNCPFCKEEIKIDAIKCKHCGEFIEEKQPKEVVKLKPFNYNLSIGLGISNFLIGLIIILIAENIETENVYFYGFSFCLIFYFGTIYKFYQYINNFEIKKIVWFIKIHFFTMLLGTVLIIVFYMGFFDSISFVFLVIGSISLIASFICFLIFSINFLNNKFDIVGGLNIVGLCNLIFIALLLVVAISKVMTYAIGIEGFEIYLLLFQVPLIGILFTFFKAKSYSRLNSDLVLNPDTDIISSKPKLKITKLIIFSILTILIIVAAYIIYWGYSTYWLFY